MEAVLFEVPMPDAPMPRGPMPDAPRPGVPRAPFVRRRRRPAEFSVLKVLGAVVVGLIATLFVYYLIGAALFGQRPSWSVGQGEGFRVFLVSGGAAPFGGLYWGVVAARFQVRQAGSRAWWIALAICLLAGVAVHLALDPGP